MSSEETGERDKGKGKEGKGKEGKGKEETEEYKRIMDEWPQINEISVQDYFDKGFKPYKREKESGGYISLKRGRYEKGLGPYSDERWDLLTSMMGKDVGDYYLASVPDKKGKKSKGKKGKKNILGTKINRPSVIPASITPSLDTLYYYMMVQKYGYEKSFENFVNETVKAYFLRNGISPGLILTVKEGGEID